MHLLPNPEFPNFLYTYTPWRYLPCATHAQMFEEEQNGKHLKVYE